MTLSVAMPRLNRTKVASLPAGATVRLSGVNMQQTPQWVSADRSVATVDRYGVVTAVGKGTTTITARYYDDEYTCRVTVPAASLTKKTAKLKAGKTLKLKVKNCRTGGSQWVSSNRRVADVDKNGTVKAIAPGEAQISVYAAGEWHTCIVTVTGY